MEQLLLHLIGDYVTQTDWMATEKTKRNSAAAVHAVVYSLPFLLLSPSLSAFVVIIGTHFLIDRFRLARYVVFAKNHLSPKTIHWCDYGCETPSCGSCRRVRYYPWSECQSTGYYKDMPPWLAFWLLIICDNTMHLCINYAALRWL